MGAVVRELEGKYEPAAEAEMPDLTALDGIASVAGPETQELGATYFDTDRLALAAAGLTLRRRTGGGDAGWHLKVPSPDGGLDELREPVGGHAADVVPTSLERAVQLYARGQTLRPVAEIRTRRRIHRLCDADGRTMAELCDDLVTADTPGDLDGRSASSWREWEVELVDGDEALLETAGALLEATGARPAAGPSKLARALGNRIPKSLIHPDEPPGPKSSAAEVLGARLREQVSELKYRDPLVRHDAPDAVHRMRVAMRRLRSDLASYRPLLDRNRTEPRRDELKWIAGVLGDARDTEVMQARLSRLISEEPVELVMGPVAQRVDRQLAAAYRLAHRRAVEAIESPRYYALIDDLDALVTNPRWTSRARQPAADVLPARVAKAFKRLRRRVDAVAEAPDRQTRDHRLHEVRKAAKRARYAAEPLVPVVGRDAERFVKATKKLQSVLGDYQDAVVTQPTLRQLAVQAHLDGDNAFTYGRLHGRQQALAASLRAGYHEAWSRAKAKKRRRWLR
ncbi:CYTH and CHAD domain-containing protein [Nocardioides bizhenqiangii]|uniref:CYTH and CHAD domain-containing protein n=2 Tax=Nocardioides bizhenqiangii TaxID=3095076 RepID=A0ABZ0ZWL6_9ACTN|nr:CYTH and CHAD domain-containing protein [Nocardioides sp. HM61]WQQ28339.1 CYTH and CHAD domain-containing protein [Nocardioides sp. HM61]